MKISGATIIGGIGRTLIGLGVLVLAFAAFQLWGTSFAESQAQGSLEEDFLSQLAAVDLASDASGSTEIDSSLLPSSGDAAGKIEIPSIGVEKSLVEGVTRDVLRLGPGHYPDTPLPGQAGNASIAGHRTTHGAPFFDIDKVAAGDEIFVETLQGRFRYVVEGHTDSSGVERGHFIVSPTATDVLSDKGDNRLTLTACHPKYSARQRIIVTAVLAGEPAPTIERTITNTEASLAEELAAEPVDETPVTQPSSDLVTEPETDLGDDSNLITADDDGITESLGWQPEHAQSTALWGAVAAAIVLAGLILAHFWRRWPSYLLAAPPFLFCTFIFFTQLDKFLPAV